VTLSTTLALQAVAGPTGWQVVVQSLKVWPARVPPLRTHAASEAVWAVPRAPVHAESLSGPMPIPLKVSVHGSAARAMAETESRQREIRSFFMVVVLSRACETVGLRSRE
jgi:hypothetical protein